jgi:hypothetical protein
VVPGHPCWGLYGRMVTSPHKNLIHKLKGRDSRMDMHNLDWKWNKDKRLGISLMLCPPSFFLELYKPHIVTRYWCIICVLSSCYCNLLAFSSILCICENRCKIQVVWCNVSGYLSVIGCDRCHSWRNPWSCPLYRACSYGRAIYRPEDICPNR